MTPLTRPLLSLAAGDALAARQGLPLDPANPTNRCLRLYLVGPGQLRDVFEGEVDPFRGAPAYQLYWKYQPSFLTKAKNLFKKSP